MGILRTKRGGERVNNIVFPKAKPADKSAFFQLFTKNYVQPSTPTVEAFTNTANIGDGSNYGRKALANECEIMAATSEGGRNHQLNKSAFSIGQLIAAGHVNAEQAWNELYTAAMRAGLNEKEIESTLRSGGRAGQQHARNIPEMSTETAPTTIVLDTTNGTPKAVTRTVKDATRTITDGQPETTPAGHDTGQPAAEPGPETGQEPAPEQTIEEIVKQRLPLLDWRELWADDEEEEWMLYPLIAKRRGIVIYSPPKVGKSLFVLEMAVHLALGDHWLGVDVDQPHRVLYVDFENDPKGDIRERLTAMGYGPSDLENLKYLSFPTLPGLDKEAGAAQLVAACQVYECDIVIIDTISRAVEGDENENDTWLQFYRNTGLALKQNGITMVRLDHTGKDESKGQRGGSAKSGDVDAIWKMSKVTEDGSSIRLHLDDSRMRVDERELILERLTAPVLKHKVAGAGPRAAIDAKLNEMYRAFELEGAPRTLTRKDARDIVTGRGLKVSNSLLGDAVKNWRENLAPPAALLDLNKLPLQSSKDSLTKSSED